MTLEELNYKFLKAHILMGIGTIIGVIIAGVHNLSHPLCAGLLTGLLFSNHIYRKCITVLMEEFRRLKSPKNNEKKNIP